MADRAAETPKDDKELYKGLHRLRKAAHDKAARGVAARKMLKPTFTAQEQRLGCHLEAIEEQVVDAVKRMDEKGYSTDTSGFYGRDSDRQEVKGDFMLDIGTMRLLRDHGFEVQMERNWKLDDLKDTTGLTEDQKWYTTIVFKPHIADIKKIKAQWAEAVDLLPNRGGPVENWYRAHGV